MVARTRLNIASYVQTRLFFLNINLLYFPGLDNVGFHLHKCTYTCLAALKSSLGSYILSKD